jgi:hypothetical protein
MKQTPLSSSGSTGRSSIPETVFLGCESAAYWIARSSRATTVLLWQAVYYARFLPRSSVTKLNPA